MPANFALIGIVDIKMSMLTHVGCIAVHRIRTQIYKKGVAGGCEDQVHYPGRSQQCAEVANLRIYRRDAGPERKIDGRQKPEDDRGSR